MNDVVYQWFTEGPWRYWLIAVPAGALFLAAVLFPRRFPPWSLMLVLAVCLVSFRWPIVVSGGEANADESQILAGAITLREHPVFWRDVDAHAIGPAAIYPLTLLNTLGAPLDYETARSFALLLGWTGLVASYFLLREYFGDTWARAGIVPATTFLALMRHWDLAHYSAETVALPLLACGAACAFIGIKRGSRWLMAAGACFLALTVWTKLQAAPIALAIFAGAIFGVYRACPADKERRRKLLIALSAGGTACIAVPLAAIAVAGVWTDFVYSYLRAGAVYLGQSNESGAVSLWHFLTIGESGYPAFAWPLVFAIAASGAIALRRPSGSRVMAATLTLAAVVSAVVVAAPGRTYAHYLELTVIPLSLAAAACAAPLFAAARRQRVFALGFMAITALPQVAISASSLTYRFDFPPGVNHLMFSDTAILIRLNAPPGSTLCVWGWEPRLYVMTGLPQATREAHTERQIVVSASRDYYRSRFLNDFRRRPPTVFVDAIVPDNFAFQDRRVDGIATWPELGMLITTDYQFIGSADGRRVYRRIQR